jgi:hypothetical protein
VALLAPFFLVRHNFFVEEAAHIVAMERKLGIHPG